MVQKPPNLHHRSFEEVEYHCAWLARLGMLSLEHIVDALHEGDRRGAMDACFVGLPGVPDHGSEYDGGFYHGVDRLRGDADKTQRMLQYEDLLVCRVRVNAPPLDMSHDRLIIAHVDKPTDAVDAMSCRFADHISDASVRLRLLTKHRGDTSARRVAHELFMWADAEYKSRFFELSHTLGTELTHKLMCVSGIKSRLADGTVVRILDRLRGAPYNIRKLETFMCGGVAARFDDEKFLFHILDRLQGAPYNIRKLETFMCDGVAARFDDEEYLFHILDRLRGAPYNIRKLETFMCDGVAARFDDEKFLFRILDRLQGAPYNIRKLETFMCNGVAARFDDEEHLFRILDRLQGAPYNIRKLETFMCGGVAARFDDEEYLHKLAAMPVLNKSRAITLCRSFPLRKRARGS